SIVLGSDLVATSSITVIAGDDVILPSGRTLTSPSIHVTVDSGGDPDAVGGTASLLGHLNGTLATVSGGPDDDTFILVPDDTTLIAVHGAGGFNTLTYQGAPGVVTFAALDHRSGTIASPGFADVSFDNIDTVSGTVTAAIPEPAT